MFFLANVSTRGALIVVVVNPLVERLLNFIGGVERRYVHALDAPFGTAQGYHPVIV